MVSTWFPETEPTVAVMVGVPVLLSRYLKLAEPVEVRTLVMFVVSAVSRKVAPAELVVRFTVVLVVTALPN
jgi:hypothetical protein